MNEMMVTGWFYLKTDATTNEEAYEDFVRQCKIIGLNCDNINSIIVRDSDGADITQMHYY